MDFSNVHSGAALLHGGGWGLGVRVSRILGVGDWGLRSWRGPQATPRCRRRRARLRICSSSGTRVCALNPEPYIRNPEPGTRNPEPSTLNPEP
ncbi:hypothetical protein T484DRAFT_1960723 [Baffinella frigidus]|nr:hypothetical protein T484DRAFT_1960723 [Cryptophyta sp. CCMP2293]